MKKRFLVLGLVAFELAMLPFAGHMLHKTSLKLNMADFTKPQRAINVKIGSEPGITRYMVSADAPFTVTSETMMGQFDVDIYANGIINGKTFGANAQKPGPDTACSQTQSLEPRVIYRSDKGTVAREGKILSQAILVEIRYEPYYKPDVKIMTQKKSKNILSAQPCQPSAPKTI